MKYLNRPVILSLLASAILMGCSETEESETKASCNPTAVASTRSAISSADCIAIDLSSPASADSKVAVSEESGVLTLTLKTAESLCLSLSGAYDGGVKIKNSNNVDVDLILNSITITSNAHPGFLKLNTGNELWGNTYLVQLVGTSSITGAASEDSKKALSAEPNLSFTGDGTLNITARYKTGIGCDDVLTVYSGNISIAVDRSEAAKTSGYEEKGFGIKAVNGFVMKGGSVSISANDNITGYESRGIKVDGSDETACNTGKGYIHILDGSLTISADAKALTAGWEADEDATTSTTSDDPYPDIEISGGKLTLTTTGTPRENSTNSLSPEGIEGKRHVTISGGEIIVNTTDDAIQAGNTLTIGGGKIFARATSNDAIDSNGSILISGGQTIAFGASQPEAGLDADNNSNVNYTGGLLIAIGGDNNAPQGSATTGSFVSASLGTSSSGGMGGPGIMGGGSSALAGITLALAANGSSDVIAAAKVPSDYVGGTNLLILSDAITSGTSYDIYQSPTLSPASLTWFNDALLLESATLSGDSSASVTAGTAAGGTGGGPGGGTPGGGGPGGGGPGGGGPGH